MPASKQRCSVAYFGAHSARRLYLTKFLSSVFKNNCFSIRNIIKIFKAPSSKALPYNHPRMCRLGGMWGVAPPRFSNLQESWSKRQRRFKRVEKSIFYDLLFIFLLTIVGELDKTSPLKQKASQHITAIIIIIIIIVILFSVCYKRNKSS